jgi:hypothetical protein
MSSPGLVIVADRSSATNRSLAAAFRSNGVSVTSACQARATRSVGSHAVGWFGAPASPT